MKSGFSTAFGTTRLLLAVLACLSALPAAAADVGQLSCPVDALSPTQRDHLADHVRRQAEAEEPAMQALYRATLDCSVRHGWSRAAQQQAIGFNLSVIGQREARLALEQRGVDVAAVERALLSDRSLVEAVRTESAAERFQAFYDEMDPAIRRQVDAGDDGGSQGLLGTFVLFRAMMETTRADFAAQ